MKTPYSISRTVGCLIFTLVGGLGGSYATALALPLAESYPIQQQANDQKLTGTISDEAGNPIIGASIVVVGTKNGVVTDLDGKFSIGVSMPATIEISYIGYKKRTMRVSQPGNIQVTLEPDNNELHEVVVTALGIKREKKSLGYAMQEVNTAGMSENRSTSVANMLQGKVAGVQISQSGTGIGGSTRIVMRGLSSLSGNNRPLWVVDGIPINDDVETTANQWGGSDSYGAASQINPEDIETISVLKGANAAALYGSRAQNGAIIVTTKSGTPGQPLTVEYNANVEMSKIYSGYDYQNIYGQGSNGAYDATAKGSWGPGMEGQTVDSWRKVYYGDTGNGSYALLRQGDRIKDFYRTGWQANNSAIISTGGKNMTARFSFTDSRNKGVTPNHKLNRQYYGMNIEMKDKWLDISAKANYMHEITRNAPAQGEYGVMQQLVLMPRSIRLCDLASNNIMNDRVVNWAGPSDSYSNPYGLVMNENGNKNVRDRLIGRVKATVTFTDYLNLTGRVGIDRYHDTRKTFAEYLSDGSNTTSQYARSEGTTKEFNADLILNFNKRFGLFDVTANLGTSVCNIDYDGLAGDAGSLQVPHLIYMNNGSKRIASESYSKKEIQSVFANANLGWKSMLYLDLTGRNDWSSTLPKSNRSYFYPSVSLSAIISEMVKLPAVIDYLKVRSSYAQVGNDTDPYKLAFAYSAYFSYVNGGSILEMKLPDTYPLFDLKPEKTNSFELGLEYRMFGNRLGIDFTYYNTVTKNQILSIGTVASSGYTSKMINAGEIAVHGFELMLTGTPVKTRDWQWDVNLNWGLSRTKCNSLTDGVSRYTLGETRVASVVVQNGGNYGDIVAVKAFKRNENGQILVDNNGLPVTESDKVIGNMTPKWTGSVGNTVRRRDFSLSALVDVREGGNFISMTDAYATTNGNSARSLAGRDGMVVDGVLVSIGEKNTKEITAEQYWNAVGGSSAVAELFMYKSTYVKLRELSVGWNLPRKWLSHTPLRSVKFSLVGRDLFYIYKNAPLNPESSFSREDYAQAFEYASLPPTRNFGFSLNVKF